MLVAAAIAAQPADGTKRAFDLPADSAEKAIRRFSEQTGLEVFYPSGAAKGVRTQRVKGEMTAREALDAMVAGTGLVVVRDEKTGAFSVKRVDLPNGQGVARANRDHPVDRNIVPDVDSSVVRRAAGMAAATSAGETIQLSPFEVSGAGDRGYYGANTMSGTRLNSKLEDLASSMTVVTKEQMADFAMLDINDIFNHEAGTEGTGNYTELTFNANGDPESASQLNPTGANRIRGLGSANISFGNFSTSGRVPIDPSNIDGVEISRGPNSNIFGLGNASGTVNSVPATANLTRNRSQVQFRGDSFDGFRGSIDLNRVLKKDVLAIRGSAVYQRDAFDLKPSGQDSVRLNGMVKYRPFKNTTLTGSFSTYRMHGNRPNVSPPMDAVSFWKASGSPTWDPLNQTAYVNGVPVAVVSGGSTGGSNTAIPYFTNALLINNGGGSGIIDVDPNGRVTNWRQARASSTTSPLSENLVRFRYLTTNPENFRITQPLFQTALPVKDKSLYDWSSINLAAMNYQAERTNTAMIQLEQILYNSDRQMLAAQGAWFQEDSNSYRRLINGSASASGTNASRANSGYLFVDPNIRLFDGTPNPNFLRPNIGFSSPKSSLNPVLNNSYRAQLAYQLVLAREPNFLRWFGIHQMSAYGEYRQNVSRRYNFQDAIVSDHAWLPAGVPRGSQSGFGSAPYNQASVLGTRAYYQYYVGDNVGQNIEYAPAPYKYSVLGAHPYRWGNPATGQFVDESVLLGSTADLQSTGGSNNTNTILKTRGAVLQSHLLRGRIVTTFGLRTDENFVKRGVPAQLLPDAKTHDYANDRQWIANWEMREGTTKTAGVVVKPLRWLNLHWNKSDSFLPSFPAQSIYLKPLPNPSGLGNDYGFSLNLFDGKFSVRVNRYETKQINARNGSSAVLAVRTIRVDAPDLSTGGTPLDFGLAERARIWTLNAAERDGVTLTKDQLDTRIAAIMKFSVPQLQAYSALNSRIYATDDVLAKGNEVELNFNPTSSWTLKANVTETKAIQSAISADVTQWLAERMAVWQSIIDPETNTPWFTTAYTQNGDLRSPSNYMTANVLSQYALQRQTEGKARPQIRRYRVNLSTNFRLAGITEHRWLKRFNVGGSVRWEDKAAIGYYGLQQLPAIITDLDPNRPIWSKGNFYVDALVGYRTKLFKDKVGATVQLNVRNIQENGRLQPVSALPDGTPNAYRIIDPRQFILTMTFDL